ncbi:MAG: TetR/AcrR family transcriptional regulator [Chloroflexi bacterium]|nr:TetR/AcrR family transcriptional regulator [Chloroflexota bacterium]MCL5108708.1 TetR/AcrR family transcriptional regulator [Chloroflexota bacterium]
MPRRRREPAEEAARQEERRRQILDAATGVFCKYGFARARTRDIAAAAGVSEGTLYNYYASKRDILAGLAQRVVDDTTPGLVAQLAVGPDADWLPGLLADRMAVLERNLPLLHALLPELLVDEGLRQVFLQRVLFPLLAAVVPNLKNRLPATSPLNLRVVLPAMIGGLLATYLANVNLDLPLGGPQSRQQIIDQLATFYQHGLEQSPIRLPEEVSRER